MKRPLILIGGAIGILLLISLIVALRTESDSAEHNFFKVDFMTAVTNQVTSGLTRGETPSPPHVTLAELGEISPAVDMIHIETDESNPTSGEPGIEYIVIRADRSNAQPINISDWSLQSMISDTWIGLPRGTERYTVGEVNSVDDIYLNPGERAIITSGRSPVGVSFRVNRCSGFLGSTQKFEPKLDTRCIDPTSLLPPTIDNIKEYGSACVAFAERLPSCTYVTNDLKNFNTLSQKCIEHIQPRITHNFCNSLHQEDEDFYTVNEWRVFLNQRAMLWREQHEVIRLLDEKHRTVDVFRY